LHLLPHWNWSGKEGQEIEVWAHSNCDEVELLLNGVGQGRQKMTPRSHLQWKVKYEPGTLLAKGFRDGKEIAQDKVETAGAPAAATTLKDSNRQHGQAECGRFGDSGDLQTGGAGCG